jgi:hypothetical protein
LAQNSLSLLRGFVSQSVDFDNVDHADMEMGDITDLRSKETVKMSSIQRINQNSGAPQCRNVSFLSSGL